eukprot:1151297-Pelagomonas_calceolata.AAC.1
MGGVKKGQAAGRPRQQYLSAQDSTGDIIQAQDLTNLHAQFQHLFSSAPQNSATCLRDFMNQADVLGLANEHGALHIILVGVAGTIYNDYTIKSLIDLGLTRQKAKSSASKLSSTWQLSELPCYPKNNNYY